MYDGDKIHFIKFWDLDGDDSFEFHGMRDVITVGGSGNDTLICSGSNDKLYGGSDRDVLKSGAGNDAL